MDQKEVIEFLQTFKFLQRFGCFEAIDEMFIKLINEDWSKESFNTNKQLIVNFTRSNCLVREKLKYYEPFLTKSIEYLNENNYDPMKLLKGII